MMEREPEHAQATRWTVHSVSLKLTKHWTMSMSISCGGCSVIDLESIEMCENVDLKPVFYLVAWQTFIFYCTLIRDSRPQPVG